MNVVLHGEINNYKKEAGLEVKWNANRDPSQKVKFIFNKDMIYSSKFQEFTIRSFI